MKNFTILLLALGTSGVGAQTIDWKKAPNSYIYKIEDAKSQNYAGLYIPVKKAYEVWANYNYLKEGGVATPIPNGLLEAQLHWEDNPGLISNVEIKSAADPKDSKIKVSINEARGKGNAVIALKVNGEIYWSWHVWVTDDVESGGSTYKQGFETNSSGAPFEFQFMNRNLGATSAGLLNDNWQKSGGLMYEWGRKDPFPGLVDKDSYFYEINGEAGTYKHKSADPGSALPVALRPFDEIEKNIKFSVKNPLTYIINSDATGNWFSKQRYKVQGTNTIDYVSWDLWSDNAKGAYSHANSSNTAVKNDSRSYELKSELDPCPNGWRVPSYYGRTTAINNLTFFGRGDWSNDDTTDNAKLLPNTTNPYLTGTKVYPGIGMDFRNAQSGARNLGIIPLPGAYVYYPNSAAPNAPVDIIFQDYAANGGLWSATYGFDGARMFSIVADPFRTNTSVGLHAIYVNQTNPSRTGNAVRCMKDPNLTKIGDFPTEYFTRQNDRLFDESDLELPNTYVVPYHNELEIPVRKAFAAHFLLLSDHVKLSPQKLVAKVLWTTNTNMIKTASLEVHPTIENSVIKVSLNPNEYGNAVLSLHDSSGENPALWSWLIWRPIVSPDQTTYTYTTENTVTANGNFVKPTVSKLPPITSEFMTMNIGAMNPIDDQSNAQNANRSFGLHFQWGRKDAIPNFEATEERAIYLGNRPFEANAPIDYHQVSEADYNSYYTASYATYGNTSPEKYKKLNANIKYSVENPLKFLYQNGLGAVYDGGNANNNNLSLVKDWVSDERNQMPERWGHGTKKSPYDPCPVGWRVPDVTFTNLYMGSKGNSPWFNGRNNDAYGKPGVIQNQWHLVSTFYGGSVLPNIGWVLNAAAYAIGNYPADGIRGEVGEFGITKARSGVWTASLADLATGYALGMQFQSDKMQTGTGIYPQAGMGVRCSRDFSVPIISRSGQESYKSSNRQAPKLAEQEIAIFYQNVSQELTLSSNQYTSYQLYDASGKLVKEGHLNGNKISNIHLVQGMFLLKLVGKFNDTVTKKLIVK